MTGKNNIKRVLLVACNDLGNGGIQRVMMDIVHNLSGEFHFDIVLFSKEESYHELEFKKYGKIFRLPHKGENGSFRGKLDKYIRFPRLYFGVKKFLQEHGPYDVIHCHNYFEAAPCLMAAKHCGVTVRISHSHNSMPHAHLVAESMHSIYRKLINSYATHRIGCSQMAADYLFGPNTGAISIPNIIDLKRFDISRYPAPKARHSFIHVGRFGTQKNQLFVLDVFKEIQARWPDATLTFVGEFFENYDKLFLPKLEKLQLKNVKILPHNSDIPALFARSEYMIFPSTFEGLPLTLLEAQAMRVKCFVSNNVTREADIGWCQYLSLRQPPIQWAQAVFDTENKVFSQPNTAKLSLAEYVKKIGSIYNGEKIK